MKSTICFAILLSFSIQHLVLCTPIDSGANGGTKSKDVTNSQTEKPTGDLSEKISSSPDTPIPNKAPEAKKSDLSATPTKFDKSAGKNVSTVPDTVKSSTNNTSDTPDTNGTKSTSAANVTTSPTILPSSTTSKSVTNQPTNHTAPDAATTTATPTNTTTTPTNTTTTTTNSKPSPTTSLKPDVSSSTESTSSSSINSSIASPTDGPASVRRFDGPSFIGGIVLTVGISAISFVAFKFYKARTGGNYHTL